MRQHSRIHEGVGLTWRKSSHSTDGTSGNCVEVARTASAVFVRDSTDRDGGRLRVPMRCWNRFTDTVRAH